MLLVSEKPSEFIKELAVYLQNNIPPREKGDWGHPSQVIWTEIEIKRCLLDSGWKLVKEI